MEDKGTEKSIESLVRIHADMVYRLALLHMKNRSDADDIFQEVFLRLVKNLSKLENDEHIKAWLIRVTINCCKTQLTSGWNKKMVATDQTILEQTIDGQAPSSENENEDIRHIVGTLPNKYRSVIHLFYFEDLSISQIAKTLRIKEGTVKGQLSRGRDMIREIVKKGGASYERERTARL